MDGNSTRFLHHYEIDSSGIDLLPDAFGIDALHKDLTAVLDVLNCQPDEKFLDRFITGLRNKH